MIDGIRTCSTVLSCDSTHCSTDSVAWALRTFGTLDVEVITAPGMDALLAGVDRPGAAEDLLRVQEEAGRTVTDRDSRGCLIMGHCHCRANRVDFEEHRAQLVIAKRTVEGWGLFPWIEIGLFNPEWEYRRIAA